MKGFNDFLKVIEKEDKGDLFQMVHGLSARILPALVELGGKEDTLKLYCSFILATLAADGRLAEEEFLTIEPMFRAFFGDQFDYEDCRKMIKGMDDSAVVNALLVVFNRLPEEVRGDMILVAFILCAVDGKVSHKERVYLEKLLS